MNTIAYYLKVCWSQYRAEGVELRKRLKKIKTGRPYETSITEHMLFYVGTAWLTVMLTVVALFFAAVAVAVVNAGLWWIAGLIVGV